MKHFEVARIVEAKFNRYAQAVIAQIKALPPECRQSGDDSPLKDVWEEWKDQMQNEHYFVFSLYEYHVEKFCHYVVMDMPEDEQQLLWLLTDDYFNSDEDEPPCGGQLTSAVEAELYKRVCSIATDEPLAHENEASASRIDLHTFIIQLVDAWNADRAEDPKNIPSAAQVTKTIWDSEYTMRLACLKDDANALTIADVLENEGKCCFGSEYWEEMEDYINRISSKEREMINLREFTEIFYDVLRRYGSPD